MARLPEQPLSKLSPAARNRLIVLAVITQIAMTVVAVSIYFAVTRLSGPAAEPSTQANGQPSGAAVPPTLSATPPPSQPTYRANASRTGFYDSKAIDAVHGTRWSVSTSAPGSLPASGSGNGIYSSNAVASAGTVFLGTSDGSLRALDASTSRELWKYVNKNKGGSTPTVSGDTVFSGGGSLAALDAGSGSVKWNYPLATDAATLVSAGTVYAGSGKTMYALTAADGSLKWQFDSGDPRLSAPALDGGTLFFGGSGLDGAAMSDDGKAHSLYAVDAATGTELWRHTVPETIGAVPAAAGGIVYFVSYHATRTGGGDPRYPQSISVQGALHALDARTGAELWKFETDTIMNQPVAVAGGLVFLANGDRNYQPENPNGYIRALDARTGAEKWLVETGPVLSPPSVAGGRVYLASNEKTGQGSGLIYCLDAATGEQVWTYRLSARPQINTELVFSDGTLYLSGNELLAIY